MSGTFAIVNLRDGVRRDVASFLPNNDSFPFLENAFLFRGRIQRRSGFSKLGTGTSRLRWQIGTTAASPFVFILPDASITTTIAQFSIGSVFFTDPGGASPVVLLSTDPTYSGTLDRTTGTVTLTFPVIAPTPVFYYPGLPVMGLRTLEDATLLANQPIINDEKLLGFDTRYSYLYDNGTQDFIAANQFVTTNTVFVWEGTNSDFFWTVNYFQVLWATNNIAGLHAAVDADAPGEGDGLRWFNSINNRWSNFNPGLNGTTTPLVAPTVFLTGALIILPYKDRLVVLNTLEGATVVGTNRFPQRARWSQNGTPFYVNAPAGVGTEVNAWSSVEVGRGGFIDAPTSESIVSAEFIKDTLIVYFERSTWQLIYTGNENLPFVWQKINTELGSESTFSIVPFDRGVFGIGNYGVITCDSVNVTRIDQKIPDEIFHIQNLNNGVKRVHGIRDYNAQLVYWTYPINDNEINQFFSYQLTFPNRLLVYNYLDGSWAFFDDSFTCFGYWQRVDDVTWAQLNFPWLLTGFSWNSQLKIAKYQNVIAGNQRGFVFVISQQQELGINSPSLEISNITVLSPSTANLTIPDHNLVNNDFILITSAVGVTNFNNRIFKIFFSTANIITIDTDPINNPFSGTYAGGGFVTFLPNFSIQTKQFNPFYEKGDSVRLNYADIYIERTQNGQFTAKFFTNSNESVSLPQLDPNLPADPVVLTRPESAIAFSSGQTRIWHRVYMDAFGSFFQNEFTFSDAEMEDLSITTSNITIHGLVYYVNPAGRISYDI